MAGLNFNMKSAYQFQPKVNSAVKIYQTKLTLSSASASLWQADMVWGHLCWSLLRRHSEEALRSFLELYENRQPPILISDGCPGDFLPAPRLPVITATSAKIKAERIDAQIQRKNTRMTGWLTLANFNQLRQQPEIAVPHADVSALTGSRIQPKNQLNRLTGTTSASGEFLYEITEHLFREITLYWKIDDAYQTVVEDFLVDLQMSGYGKRKSVGYGQIASISALQEFNGFAEIPKANGFVSLSRFVPHCDDPTDGCWETTVKYGRLGEELANTDTPFKCPLVQLVCGATFLDDVPQDFYGQLMRDLSPDKKLRHYAFAFALPTRMPQITMPHTQEGTQDHTYKSNLATPYERGEYKKAQDDNLENLIANWELYKDKIILFLGAGASIGAKDKSGKPFPSAYDLRNELWYKFMNPRPDFKPEHLGLMGLEEAATLCQMRANRRSVEEFIAERFESNDPLWQHTTLPFLKPKAVFTTNYDTLIEKGWQASNAARVAGNYVPVSGLSAHNRNLIPIFKPHGSIEFPHEEVSAGGIVISRFDYYDMIKLRQVMLEKFMETLRNHCVLFIGYSFQDMDIAAHLYELRKNNKAPKWYAIFPRDDHDVRNMFLQKYDTLQINRRFHDFMHDLDQRVDFIPSEWKFEKIPDLITQGKIAS